MVKLVNRTKMTTATTGTGTITLGSAVDGYQTFADAGVADADVVRYVIEDGDAWEIGTGTYTASGTTLSRTVSESSNADAAINLSGSAVVFVTAAAEDIPSLELYAENPSSPTAPSATGTNAVAIGSNTTSSGSSSIAMGVSATATATNAIAIGAGADATQIRAVAIGYNPTASSLYALALGATSGGQGANAVTGSGAISLGSYASGTDSFAAAIANNTSSYGATGANSVAIGSNNKATSTGASAIGGYYNQATGSASMTFGNYNVSSGTGSVVVGTRGSTSTNYKYVYSGRSFGTSVGQGQYGLTALAVATSDATPTALTTDDASAGTTNQIILPNNSAYAFHGTIVARQQASAGTACAAWKIEGLIRREGSAGTTVLVNSATTVIDNTPSWGMALSADTTNGGLKIEVTGAAATNIRFVATINTSEVTYS